MNFQEVRKICGTRKKNWESSFQQIVVSGSAVWSLLSQFKTFLCLVSKRKLGTKTRG